MEPGTIISAISVLATAGIAITGLLLSERRHREQIENERKSKEDQISHERQAREEELAREIERAEKHREDMPLLQFDMEVGTTYKKGGEYLVEFRVILDNRGNVKQDIKSIKLRVRTVNKEDNLSFWSSRGFRAEFPHKVFETEIIPEGYKFIFVEPNVKQILNYTTILHSNVELVAARAEFSYGRTRKSDRGSKHSVEKIFELDC